MDDRKSLIAMLDTLHQDTLVLHQQGAGYYSCAPLISRYNKLLHVARGLFTSANGLIESFDDIAESVAKDPADKMKVLQSIRIEIGQLLALLRSTAESASEDKD